MKLINPKVNPIVNAKGNPTVNRKAILLINLGSPAHSDPLHVGLFLKQFLWDKRVVKINRIMWWVILHFFVIPFRSKRLSKLYHKIWTLEGSPLISNTKNLSRRLEKRFSEENTPISVYTAMTYGNPSIETAILEIAKNEITHLIVLPLFPQYSGTTTGAVYDAISNCFKKNHQLKIPSLRFISHYYHENAYLLALASSIERFFLLHGQMERLLFSFHGLPKKQIAMGDPYETQCQMTAKHVANMLKLPENYWKIAFQSRFGLNEWTGPSVEEQLLHWIEEGITTVVVIAPSFAVDCLETLEEIEIRTREFFLKKGGKSFHYIPALNDSELHVDVLSTLIKKNF